MESRAKQSSHNVTTPRSRVVPDAVAAIYHKAFELYGPLCFWSIKEMAHPTVSDVMDAASRLKREGNMNSRRIALRLEEACVGAS